MEQDENHARYLKTDGHQDHGRLGCTDFRQLLRELTDAKNNLVQPDECVPRQCFSGVALWLLGHLVEDDPDIALLELESRITRTN